MTDFPVMRGDARVARGASYFEVPLFSHVKDNLWQGCSPAEFPDHDSLSEPEMLDLLFLGRAPSAPVKCKYLMEWDSILLRDRPRFDKILNLYQWGNYEVPEGTEQLTVEMYDSEEGVSEQVEELSDQVVNWLNNGDRVLVHCQAGLNRSSLVVARVLMKKYDMYAYEAIKLLRDQRSQMCLCNDTFVKHLLEFDHSTLKNAVSLSKKGNTVSPDSEE